MSPIESLLAYLFKVSIVTNPSGLTSNYLSMAIFIRVVTTLLILPIFSASICATTLSEADIASFASEINKNGKGADLGGGTVIRNVFSKGRTLVYQYNVPSDWQPSTNGKKELITQAKSNGSSKVFFNDEINTTYQYFKGNLRVYDINIFAGEYSSVDLELDDKYVSIEGHVKSKNINMKLRPPEGWSVEEANGPNIVKVFKGKPGQYYMIVTKDMPSFSTRSQIKEIYSDPKAVQEYAESVMPEFDCTLINYDAVTLNTYPAITHEYICKLEQSGIQITAANKVWTIFYEDKMIILQGSSAKSGPEFEQLKKLFTMVSITAYFPEQFN